MDADDLGAARPEPGAPYDEPRGERRSRCVAPHPATSFLWSAAAVAVVAAIVWGLAKLF